MEQKINLPSLSIPTEKECVCLMMMEDLMHTSSVGLERRGDKKRRFLNTGYSALQYYDLISCCLSTGKYEEELRRSCSVQVVQVFLFYFSPESVPLLSVCGTCSLTVRLKLFGKRNRTANKFMVGDVLAGKGSPAAEEGKCFSRQGGWYLQLCVQLLSTRRHGSAW